MNYSQFTLIAPHIGYGSNSDENWFPLTNANLLILVGVTGVGKSRTVDELSRAGIDFTLLPNRRLLTDHLIIGAIQRLDGDVDSNGVAPIVRDRRERFGYTRRYRDKYPGGMAQALSNILIHKALSNKLLLFDGLRGVNEVTHATQQLPNARFIALYAPDRIRVERLLSRNDVFDQMTNRSSNVTIQKGTVTEFSDLFPDAVDLQLDAIDEERLRSLLDHHGVASADMGAKLAIVSEERRNYDPDATLIALQAAVPARLCAIDTAANGPEACANQIVEWLSMKNF